MPWAQGGRAFKSPRPDHPYVTDLFAPFAFGAPSAPVANWGVLGFPEALTIYNFVYSRFPSAGSGPSAAGEQVRIETFGQLTNAADPTLSISLPHNHSGAVCSAKHS